MKLFLLIISLIGQSQAQIISARTPGKQGEQGSIVLTALWEAAGHPAVERPLDSVPAPIRTPIPTPRKSAKQEVPSKGASAVQKMLEENRRKLKDMQAKQKEKEKESPQPKGLQEEYRQKLARLKRTTRQTYADWNRTRQETYKRWKEARKQFHRDLPIYKENLFELAVGDELPPKILTKSLSVPLSAKYQVIPHALDLPSRGQGRRPTCAAFAGIRAIETLLAAHGKQVDLSEQYFYWASKPACQQIPCSKRGSWVLPGFKHSANAPYPDIPLESNCPYQPQGRSSNETQTPLIGQCRQGLVKVEGFERLSSLDEIYQALQKGRPVIAGTRLSPNFYENEGLVTLKDSQLVGRVDSHAKGHAVLLVGTMELPKELHPKEGRLCFITANSWGEGWGLGGHSCLTEKWLQTFRIKSAFVALKSVRM